ncbi:MAG: VOC family protein [Acidimicrobiales bacterium]|nr:VOC family protein [Acidimicrobiales bacterium]
MPINRLNHAVLYVRDVSASVSFYEEVLGFRVVNEMPGRAAFLQAPASTNDHDLGLFEIGPQAGPSDAGQSTVGLYHLAWEVDTLNDLQRLADALAAHGALVGATDHSSTKSLYGKDPNGLEFELAWVVPAALLDQQTLDERMQLRPLDLPKEIARFGGETVGGVGVSRLS